MTTFLALASTYDSIEIALITNAETFDRLQINKIEASQQIITSIQTLLERNKLTLKDLAFIAVNQGPGPFTTLRVAIATANGISFASNIPLVGVDALDALLTEHASKEHPITVALMNAFNGDVYFGISAHGSIIEKGCQQVAPLLERIRSQFPDQTILCIGNGASLYAQEITIMLGERVCIANPEIAYASIAQFGALGFHKWQQQEGVTNKIVPLYLKQFKLFGRS